MGLSDIKAVTKYYLKLGRDISKNYLRWHYKFVPSFLGIESTTLCNAGCTYCARFETPNLPGPHLDIELFKAIVDAVPFVDKCAPYGRGEPFMYPHIVEAIQYLTDSGKKSLLYSNGSIMNDKLMTDLFEAGLDDMSFSIDTDQPEEFEKIRGLPWDTVLANVIRAVEIRDELKAKTMIQVRCCTGDFNISRIPDIRRFWTQYVDRVVPMPYIEFPSFALLKAKPTMNMPMPRCRQLYNVLNVRADGGVPFCCNDWFSCVMIGKLDLSVTPDKILSMYNSPRANKVRYAMESGRGAPTLCAYCDTTRRVRKMQEGIRRTECDTL